MDLLKKIKWKRGMEITPSTFEETDRYWETANHNIRKLATLRSFGLTPWTSKNICVTFSDGQVNVKVIQMEVVTHSGVLMRIADSSISIKEPHDKGSECYIVVSSDHEIEQQINNTTYLIPGYTYDFRTLGEIKDCEIPFAKLIREHDVWRIQELYIPPCTTINADPELIHFVDGLTARINSVCQLLEKMIDPNISLLLKILKARLLDLDMSTPPLELYKLLSDMVLSISEVNIGGRGLPKFEKTTTFNPNDILKCLQPMIQYIEVYENVLKTTPTPEPEKKVEQPVDDYIEL